MARARLAHRPCFVRGALDGLLAQVTQAITQHHAGGNSGLDAGKLIGQVTDLFQNHPHNSPNQPKPASQDPYASSATPPAAGVALRSPMSYART